MTGLTSAFEWIENTQDEMLEFLATYIGYRSPTEAESEVQREFVVPHFEEMAWDEVTVVDVSEDGSRPNVNARLAGTGDGRNLLFNGHSDVVDVSEQERDAAWRTDPWNATVEGGRLYGRGANDMKGPNTAMIWAVRAITEAGIELSGDLMMSIVVGEEMVQQDVGSIPATNAFLEAGHDIPLCVNTEPTNNQIHTSSAGLMHFDITIPGKGVHGSQHNLTRYPQRHGVPHGRTVGVDVVPMMNDLLERLRDLEHEWNMRYSHRVWGSGGYPVPEDMQGVGAIALVPTLVDAGSFIASVPDRARIQGQLYVPPFLDREDLWRDLEETVDSLADRYAWLEDNPPELSRGDLLDADRECDHWPAFELPVDHPGARTLGDAVTRATGAEPVYSGFKAVNDGGFIQEVCGVDTLSFGPGDTYMGTHGPDEYVPIEQLVEAAKVYAAMMVDWCG